MKNATNQIFLFFIFIATSVSFYSCQAALSFPEQTIQTKAGLLCTLRPPQSHEEKEQALNFLKSQFEDLSSGSNYQEIVAIIRVASGTKIAGATRIVLPDKSHPYVWISQLATRTKFRQQGIGSALLEYLIKTTPYPIRLFSYGKTISFYAKFGFRSYDRTIEGKMQRDPIARDPHEGGAA